MKPALLLCTLSVLSAFPGFAQDAAGEIGQLFKALETSGCQFNRNGTWHDARKASEHLHRKYAYLRKKGRAESAESFIDLAASESSMSGKPYLVRCGSTAPVRSKPWFLGKLAEIRGRAGSH